jgi:polyhydroxybutyrate depolymerase
MRINSSSLVVSLGLILALTGAPGLSPSGFAQTSNGSFVFEGQIRNYIVFLPQNFHPHMPVVLNLHGYLDSARPHMEYTRMNEVADTAGFIAVYPEGIYPGFNTGLYEPYLGLPNVDDVGFISALIDTLKSQYDIDLSHIYSCGWSNGGHMTFKLACQLGHRFAAAGSVGGVMLDSVAAQCNMMGPFPVVMCHGTEDAVVPFNGGGSPDHWSVQQTLDAWIQNNGCLVPGDVVSIPDLDPTDSCTVEKTTYRTGSGESRVVLYKVINGGHTWPQGLGDRPALGHTNRDMNINEEMWNFFKEHENPLVNVAFGEQIEIGSAYVSLQGDSLTISGSIRNVAAHPVNVYALLEGLDTSNKDSVTLYDDGLHGDGDPADNVWGGAWSGGGAEEDMYTTSLITVDDSLNTRNRLHKSRMFTTAGPIAFGGYTITSSDTVAAPGMLLSYRIILSNLGSTATVYDVTAKVRCFDSIAVSIVQNVEISYGDLAPGQSSTGSTSQRILYSPSCPGNYPVEFTVEVSSRGMLFWKDTFTDVVVVTGIRDDQPGVPESFALEQNYPNPFNPTTTLQFSIANTQYTILNVFDVLGREIAALVNEVKQPGAYTVQWDASGIPSGVYFYRLTAGEFVQTRKAVLMK